MKGQSEWENNKKEAFIKYHSKLKTQKKYLKLNKYFWEIPLRKIFRK